MPFPESRVTAKIVWLFPFLLFYLYESLKLGRENMKHPNDESKTSLDAGQLSRVSRFVRETSSWMLKKESSDGCLEFF
jgi:hypothetical protein